jgi:hypothetical protein
MPRDLAVGRLQLECQVLAVELLLKSGIVATGASHQQAHHPEKKTKLHVRRLMRSGADKQPTAV